MRLKNCTNQDDEKGKTKEKEKKGKMRCIVIRDTTRELGKSFLLMERNFSIGRREQWTRHRSRNNSRKRGKFRILVRKSLEKEKGEKKKNIWKYLSSLRKEFHRILKTHRPLETINFPPRKKKLHLFDHEQTSVYITFFSLRKELASWKMDSRKNYLRHYPFFFSLSTITRTLKLPHKNSSEIEREREKN